eukprot:scaffold1154_cov310-Pinguiococcus_pyrenoidosus.AAC.3
MKKNERHPQFRRLAQNNTPLESIPIPAAAPSVTESQLAPALVIIILRAEQLVAPDLTPLASPAELPADFRPVGLGFSSLRGGERKSVMTGRRSALLVALVALVGLRSSLAYVAPKALSLKRHTGPRRSRVTPVMMPQGTPQVRNGFRVAEKGPKRRKPGRALPGPRHGLSAVRGHLPVPLPQPHHAGRQFHRRGSEQSDDRHAAVVENAGAARQAHHHLLQCGRLPAVPWPGRVRHHPGPAEHHDGQHIEHRPRRGHGRHPLRHGRPPHGAAQRALLAAEDREGGPRQRPGHRRSTRGGAVCQGERPPLHRAQQAHRPALAEDREGPRAGFLPRRRGGGSVRTHRPGMPRTIAMRGTSKGCGRRKLLTLLCFQKVLLPKRKEPRKRHYSDLPDSFGMPTTFKEVIAYGAFADASEKSSLSGGGWSAPDDSGPEPMLRNPLGQKSDAQIGSLLLGLNQQIHGGGSDDDEPGFGKFDKNGPYPEEGEKLIL